MTIGARYFVLNKWQFRLQIESYSPLRFGCFNPYIHIYFAKVLSHPGPGCKITKYKGIIWEYNFFRGIVTAKRIRVFGWYFIIPTKLWL